MVLERELLPLLDWLLPSKDHGPGALAILICITFLVALLLVLFSYLSTAIRRGPGEAFYITAAMLFSGFGQLAQMSPRRIGAMARLAFQEAIRRRVLVAFAIFVLIMLFAGWFLDTQSDHPARLYLSFVLTTTNFLVVMLALFLSTFSLPNDIKNRTIYTVLTKPVRTGEIVLGRVIGFTAIGTILLAIMCVFSYVFVVRGMAHQHAIAASDMEDIPPSEPGESSPGKQGRSSADANHTHQVTVDAQGKGRTDVRMGHWHPVRAAEKDGSTHQEVGPPQDLLQARVAQYGKLSHLDRTGKPTAEGLSVGDEWTYRTFFEGGTLGAAIWDFEKVTPQAFPASKNPQGLPLELNLHIFRTRKGIIERGILGSIVVIHPNPSLGLESEPIPFVAQEFIADRKYIPFKLQVRQKDGTLRDMDLMKDLVHEGKLRVRIRCLERGQYFGVAQADVYLRADDGWFWWNFVKGYSSIWMQMVLVTCFGVTFSTMLSGAIAMLATLSSIVMGYFVQYVVELSTGKLEGGGPSEAFLRLIQQKNLTLKLDPSASTTVVQTVDVVLLALMRVVSYILPDYSGFSTANYVAYGFSIPTELIVQHFLTTLGYVAVVSCVGYFFLKSREIAA